MNDLPDDIGILIARAPIAVQDRITELQAENERLQAGGCARNQRTTQYCAESAALAKENERLRQSLSRVAGLLRCYVPSDEDCLAEADELLEPPQ